jgi:chaperonin cofactor prefoldin
MKNLRFESLELLSRRESKGLTVKFHPRLTVILGENDVGKSSVIKSLYWAFGASSPKIHPTWSKANVIALVTFTINDERYRIYRERDTYGIFNGNGELVLLTNLVKELAPFLGRLLDFKLVLSNRTGEPEIPPPAYAFLPFYIDQDAGWVKPLDSFSNLTQFPDFKKDLLEFHTGILPNEYYELSAEKRAHQLEEKTLGSDRRVVQKAIERFKLEAAFDGLELSVEEHEAAIEQLLGRLHAVKDARTERASKLADLQDQRMIIDQQIAVVRASITELEKDARYAADLAETEVFCPTCGTVHRNDFANRFSIVEDREACFEFLTESRQKIAVLASQAQKVEEDLRAADHVLAEIQSSLDAKQGAVSLHQVIESRGRAIAANMFDGQLKDLEDQIATLVGKIRKIDERLGELRDKKRRDDIVDFYSALVLKYLKRLDVTNYSADEFTRIPAKISETGSDLPRALLAYFLAILGTIHKHTTSLFAPIVVDSPNQQDQDATNVSAMIDLIISERPDNAQTILGTVSLHGLDIEDGSVVEFSEKLSVLRSAQFSEVSASMQPYMDQIAS